MKRFNFRLEKLLSLREFNERKAEIELAKSIAHLDSINISLKEIATSLVKTSSQIKSDGSNLDIDALYTVQNHIIYLNNKKEELLIKAVETEAIIEEKRKLYIEAMAHRKVISKLKDKKLLEWKKENAKLEDAFIDDISTFKNGKMR